MTAGLLLVTLLAAAAPGEPGVREEARYVMGTVAVVRAEAPEAEVARAALDAAWTALDRVDSLMSTWREDSDLSRANAGAASAPVAVAPEVARLVAAALALAAASDGAFDPTVLPLMRVWGLRGGPPRRPDDAALAAARAVTGAHLVRVDTTAATIGFARRGVALDLGGIAKGYALDAAKRAMVAAGARGGVIDLGGNLLGFGGGKREFGIVAPDTSDTLVATVTIGDGAVATSGQYERYVEADGTRWGHILDPRRGLPVPGDGSVTVVAPSAQLADALATAAFVLGPEAGAALVRRHPGASCVFVTADPRGRWRVVRSGPADPGRSR